MTESIRFIVPAKDLDVVKETIRGEYPNALVGAQVQSDGSALVVVTLFASEPERPGGDSADFQARPKALSLSELVEKAKRAL